MKKFLLILIIISSSCKKGNNEKISTKSDFKNFEKEIIGNWIIKSVIRYENGIEKELDINEKFSFDWNDDGNKTESYENEDIMGTIKNPRYYKFTKHNELYVYNKEKNYEYAFKYQISENQINYISFENNASLSKMKIIYLDNNELIIEDIIDCINCNENEIRKKIVYTTNFKKE
jgi:hypothetical protein